MDVNLKTALHLQEGSQNVNSSQSLVGARPHHALGRVGQLSAEYCKLTADNELHPYPIQHSYQSLDGINDWDTCDMLRAHELEEMKSRVAQMEKTMRWWSDCTANWREKWSKVRAERNMSREEGRQLRLKLESTVKELSTTKKEKQELLNEKEMLKAEIALKKKADLLAVSCRSGEVYLNDFVGHKLLGDVIKNNQIFDMQEMGTNVLDMIDNPLKDNLYTREKVECSDLFRNSVAGPYMEKPRLILDNKCPPQENDSAKLSALKLHLEETQLALQKERESRLTMEMQIETLESDLSRLKLKYEEATRSKQDTLKYQKPS